MSAMVVTGAVLAGCAGQSGRPDSPESAREWQAWQEFALPGKRRTRYTAGNEDGRPVLRADADSSASMMRRPLALDVSQVASVQFSWHVPALIPGADLSLAESEDSPVRIVFAFDGDRSRLTLRDQMLSSLAETLTGEAMPYATLMYVWDNAAPRGSVIRSARTDRIRKIVLESGSKHCGRWLHYERDLAADYRAAFGEEPGRLVGVALMTDADNTRSRASGGYGALRLLSRDGRPL